LACPRNIGIVDLKLSIRRDGGFIGIEPPSRNRDLVLLTENIELICTGIPVFVWEPT
jgi:hypothetical protein